MKTKKIILKNVCNGKVSEIKINEALEPIIIRSLTTLLSDGEFEFELTVEDIHEV